MIKKLGVVTVGVAAALMASAPFASATESHYDDDHGSSSGAGAGDDCNVTGGSSEAEGLIEGNAEAGNLLTQIPVGGSNILNLTCNEILNDNFSDNEVAVALGGDAVAG